MIIIITAGDAKAEATCQIKAPANTKRHLRLKAQLLHSVTPALPNGFPNQQRDEKIDREIKGLVSR